MCRRFRAYCWFEDPVDVIVVFPSLPPPPLTTHSILRRILVLHTLAYISGRQEDANLHNVL